MKIINYILKIDENILLYIQNNLQSNTVNKIMKFITALGDDAFIWIFIALLLIALKKYRKTGIIVACGLSIGFIFTNLIIKNYVKRIRPFDNIEDLTALISHPSDWSFPSGHTTSSIASAIILLKYLPKKYGIPAMILAILISFSRIYIGVHYPSDVLAGVFVGVISAFLADKIVKFSSNKMKRCK